MLKTNKSLFLSILIMITILCPAKTATARGVVINDVNIIPFQPTDANMIDIIVSGQIGARPSWIVDSDFKIEGTSLELDIFIGVGPFPATSMWSHSEIIGTLSPGSYDLTVNAYHDEFPEEINDSYLTSFTVLPEPTIEAVIIINPNSLNLQSKGKWITCDIWLPEEYNVSGIEPNSIRLEGVIEAGWTWFDEEEQVAMAKFDRAEVIRILNIGDEFELCVSGEINDGTRFEGTDFIRVINKGHKKI